MARLRPPAALPIRATVAAVLVGGCSGSTGQGGFSPVPAQPTASAAPTSPSPAASSSASASAIASATADPSASATPSATTPPSASASPSVGASLGASASAPASPDPYGDVLFECFGITFPSENLLDEVDSPAAPSAGEFIRWLGEDADPLVPRDGWRLLAAGGHGDLYGVRVPERAEAGAFVVTIRNRNGAWAAEDSGACTPRVRLDETLGPATWVLGDNEQARIDARSREFDALVTEVACASGQSSEDRLSEPRVVIADDASSCPNRSGIGSCATPPCTPASRSTPGAAPSPPLGPAPWRHRRSGERRRAR
jgi:hypothetical protein